MSTPLEGILRDRIEAEGPLRFDLFMEQCLYHPEHGYYSQPGRIGRGGHYMTSPELDPAFGALWAHAFELVWQACDRPDEFTLVEVGPGEGGFAEAVLGSVSGPYGDALRIRLIERSPAMEAKQRDRLAGHEQVSWSETLPRGIACGCVFANEVLDNQPVRVLQGDQELHVGFEGAQLAEVWIAGVREFGMLSDGAPPVIEFSWGAQTLAGAAAQVIDKGALFFIDYGYEGQPPRTLATYGPSGATTEWLVNPGQRDITAHVEWSSIGDAIEREGFSTAPLITQEQALHALGLSDFDVSLRSSHRSSLAAGDGAAAVRALSRRGALAALTDPSGLGRLRVLQSWRGIDGPVI